MFILPLKLFFWSIINSYLPIFWSSIYYIGYTNLGDEFKINVSLGPKSKILI